MDEAKPEVKPKAKTAEPVTDTVTVESGSFQFQPKHLDEAEAAFRAKYSLPESHKLRLIRVDHRVGYAFEVLFESVV